MLNKAAIAVLILVASSAAHAYDTGRFTCQNLGQLAAHMLQAKQAGVPPQAYLTAIGQRLPPDAKVERQLVLEIAEVVYGNEAVSSMQPSDAYAVFMQNCIIAQQRDGAGDQDQDALTGRGGDQDDDATGMSEQDGEQTQQ